MLRIGIVKTVRDNSGLLLVFLPCFIYFVVFHYIPMVGIVVAFKDYLLGVGFSDSPWVGLENFRRLFGNPEFIDALRNTVVISLLRLAFGFVAPIILALMLNELRSLSFKKTVQTVTYIPHLLSWVILSGIFLQIFSLNGPVNGLAALMDVAPFSYLTDDVSFIIILIGTGIWQGVGYGAVIYLAALAGIPVSLYEAAMIDGANRWQQMLRVTLPSLAPTIIVLLILNPGHILDAGFDQIYNLYNPLVYDVADIIDTCVLRRMMALDFGLSTAAGLFKSVVGLILVVLANAIARRATGGEQGIW